MLSCPNQNYSNYEHRHTDPIEMAGHTPWQPSYAQNWKTGMGDNRLGLRGDGGGWAADPASANEMSPSPVVFNSKQGNGFC